MLKLLKRNPIPEFVFEVDGPPLDTASPALRAAAEALIPAGGTFEGAVLCPTTHVLTVNFRVTGRQYLFENRTIYEPGCTAKRAPEALTADELRALYDLYDEDHVPCWFGLAWRRTGAFYALFPVSRISSKIVNRLVEIGYAVKYRHADGKTYVSPTERGCFRTEHEDFAADTRESLFQDKPMVVKWGSGRP